MEDCDRETVPQGAVRTASDQGRETGRGRWSGYDVLCSWAEALSSNGLKTWPKAGLAPRVNLV